MGDTEGAVRELVDAVAFPFEDYRSWIGECAVQLARIADNGTDVDVWLQAALDDLIADVNEPTNDTHAARAHVHVAHLAAARKLPANG